MNDVRVLDQCLAILALDPGSIDSVIFDAFGTLAYLGINHSPYRKLLKWTQSHGRYPEKEEADKLMTVPLDLAEAAQLFGASVPDRIFAQWQRELQEEIDSIALYPDTLHALKRLQRRGYRVGICSNLAAPYGFALKRLLPEIDSIIFSYEVGAIKPAKEIYQCALVQLGCKPTSALFVGNSRRADFEGPRSIGMDACLISRQDNSLEMYQTDRKTRFMELMRTAACEIIGDDRAALQWLSTPISVFGHKSPLEHATTESRFCEIRDLIGRIL